MRGVQTAALQLRHRLDPDQGERLAKEDALVELIELALRCGQLPQQAGQPVQLVLTIALSDLETRLANATAAASTSAGAGAGAGAGSFHGADRFHGPGAGVLDNAQPLSAETVRRLAGDCQVIPMVLGTHRNR